MKTDYCVIVTTPDGIKSTLSHKGRLYWKKRTAEKHAADFLKRWPGSSATVRPWD